MSRSALKGIQAAAGAAGGAGVYVDDVFSTYLYEGNGSTQTITNGIDLSGEGGLVWMKRRDSAAAHNLIDTERGTDEILQSQATDAEVTITSGVSSFNSNGFSFGGGAGGQNGSGGDYTSWTFRKQPGFFDIVTYTGNSQGVSGVNQTISHNLGTEPGMIIVKRTDGSRDWMVYHRSLGATKYLSLNNTNAETTTDHAWVQTPTSTEFYVGQDYGVNGLNHEYVAYLFAHDAQDFGTDSDESIIKCGTYTGNGSSSGPSVNLGFEPQWLLLKKATGSSEAWIMHDNMRGIASNENDPQLQADGSTAEWGGSQNLALTATGFNCTSSSAQYNESGQTYIYLAIRRPHKPASELTATDLFKPSIYTGTGGSGISAIDAPTSPQAIDLAFFKSRDLNGRNWEVITRLTTNQFKMENKGNPAQGLHFNTTDGEAAVYSFSSTGRDIQVNQDSASNLAVNGENYGAWRFSRAPGFFDVVAYDGFLSSGAYSGSKAHSLNAVPEMMMFKIRNSSYSWYVWHKDITAQHYLRLNEDSAETNFAANWVSADADNINFGYGFFGTNQTGNNYVAYLFASVSGISKVGTYTGTGSDLNVDCGFSAGARFVMVKRTDSTGDWYMWDTARGIVAGNDGYLRFNLANDEDSADWIDPLSSGFTITSSAPAAINASGGTYIYYAIA